MGSIPGPDPLRPLPPEPLWPGTADTATPAAVRRPAASTVHTAAPDHWSGFSLVAVVLLVLAVGMAVWVLTR